MSISKRATVSSKEITVEHIHKFFDEFIAKIEEDKNAMLVGMATKEKTEMWEKFIRKDTVAIVDEFWEKQSINILGEMFEKYVSKLYLLKSPIKKIAFSYNTPRTINIFAIIPDNDKNLLQALVLSEDEVACEYSSKGFGFNSIIFEESDKMTVPNWYHEYTLAK